MARSRFLTADEFAYVVRHAPLISIDVVVRDGDKNVLVGFRVNEPAKGHYFVPGGIIRKDETIGDAFKRILEAEIGCQASLSAAKFLGAFEHFYDSNRFANPDYGTHYIVLAYELQLDHRPAVELDSQHSDIRWMSEADINSASDVHPYTKAYFASTHN